MNIKAIGGSIVFTLKKYSPEILMGVGIVGVVGSTVLACKATLKCEALLDTHNDKMGKVNEALEMANEPVLEGSRSLVDYSQDDAKQDRILITTQTVIGFVKLYGPSVTLMGASIGCILGAHKIMAKRNVALMAAYKVVEQAFNEYRQRVVGELGEAKDAHFHYGTETVANEETVTDEETGKKKKVKTEKEEIVPGIKLSGFARVFEPDKPDQYGGWTGSTQWSPVHDYNLSFLQAKESYFNDMLVSKGFVTMNDVYDELGFLRTDAGMIAGWRYKSARGDNYISFQPAGIDGNWATGKDGDSVILDFNIDGSIFDINAVREEMR